ncbi:Fmp32p [Ascoidea rubescens DSM 1968]|uniref:DUF1640-domain-containing protein n=1 Tax=Ascoidea rubescens DSM 1968 TaxID=1344418 RepID=A0A1D2VRW5_9ASCO|nr:DUF1640-domain-containing protein [Ascoidea rubescens DSM 1968]ODV64340.1 DUF1640-domain-containing protein [Ascoidea rubescens DSM 1968]
MRSISSSSFDTRQVIKELESKGFNSEQAKNAVSIISSCINKGITNYTKDLVKREELRKMSYQQKVDFAKLKGELQTIDRGEFNKINNEYEKLKLDLEKLRQNLKEEITKTESSVRLDLNLEKGRIREENKTHESSIKETDNRIDQEIANMRTQIDNVKTQVLQWLFGVCTGTFALILAYVRLFT